MITNRVKASKVEIFMIYLSFFLSVIAYVKDFNVSSVKYLGIVVTVLIFIKRLRGVIEIRRALVGVIVFGILVTSCLFQETTILQKFVSVAFYFVLICWLFFGEKIFIDIACIKAALMGIVSATVLGILLTWSDRSAQLANYFNTRTRIWWGFSHANTLGSIAECIIIGTICVWVLNKNVRKLNGVLYVTLIIFGCYILKVTDSRTAMISLLFFMIVLITPYLKRFDRLSRFLLMLIGLITVVVISYRFVTGYMMTDEAFTARLNAFSDMKTTLLTFFVGNGMVDSSDLDLANANGGHREIAFVQLFYKNGILGVVAYLLIFGYLLLRLRQMPDNMQKLLASAIFVSLFVGSIGEAFIVNITNVLPMFLFVLLSSLVFENPISRMAQDN